MKRNFNNILVVNKPLNWTSNDVVQKVKRVIKAKKVGHAGTLDPNADGVLVLGINEGTKELANLILDDKEYIATICFGIKTNTFDSTGLITEKKLSIFNYEDLKKVLDEFLTNEYYQVPPAFSAIKINGKKAYELARDNIEIEIKPRLVKIYEYEIIDFSNFELKIRLLVSKGFYIRSFANDLAQKLKTVGCLLKLTRTKSGPFLINEAVEIEEVYDYWIKQSNN